MWSCIIQRHPTLRIQLKIFKILDNNYRRGDIDKSIPSANQLNDEGKKQYQG